MIPMAAPTEPTQAIKSIRRESHEGKRKQKYQMLRANRPMARPANHASLGDAIHSEEHRILREIAIMKKIYHPHVVQLFEVLDDRLVNSMYLGQCATSSPAAVAHSFPRQ